MAPSGLVANSNLPRTSLHFITSDNVTLNCKECSRPFGYTANRFIEHLDLHYPIGAVFLKDSCVLIDQPNDDDPLWDEAREDIWMKAAKQGVKVDGVQFFYCTDCFEDLAAWVLRDTTIGGKSTMFGLVPKNVYLTADEPAGEHLTPNCFAPSKDSATGVAEQFFNFAEPNPSRPQAKAPTLRNKLSAIVPEIHETLSLLHSEHRYFQLEARREREKSSVDSERMIYVMVNTFFNSELHKMRAEELEKENLELKHLIARLAESKLGLNPSPSVTKGQKRSYEAALPDDDSNLLGTEDGDDYVAADEPASPCHGRMRKSSAVKRTRLAQDTNLSERSFPSPFIDVEQENVPHSYTANPLLRQAMKDPQQQREEEIERLWERLVQKAQKVGEYTTKQEKELKEAIAARRRDELPDDIPPANADDPMSETLNDVAGVRGDGGVDELPEESASEQATEQEVEEVANPIAPNEGLNDQQPPFAPRVETVTEPQQVNEPQGPAAQHFEAAPEEHEHRVDEGPLSPKTLPEPALPSILPPSKTDVSPTPSASQTLDPPAAVPQTESGPASLPIGEPQETEPNRGRSVPRTRGETRGRGGRPRVSGERRRLARSRKDNTPAFSRVTEKADVSKSGSPKRGSTKGKNEEELQGSTLQQGAVETVARQIGGTSEQHAPVARVPGNIGETAQDSTSSTRDSKRRSLPLVEIQVDNSHISGNINDYTHIDDHDGEDSHAESTKVGKVGRPELVSARRSQASATVGALAATDSVIDLTENHLPGPPMGEKDTAQDAAPTDPKQSKDALGASDVEDWNAQVAARDRLAKKAMLLEEEWE